MRLPLVPTLMVALSLPILIALGIWQLGRADEKAAMLTALAAAPDQPEIALASGRPASDLDFRRVRRPCGPFGEVTVKAGRDEAGRAGFSYFAACDREDVTSPTVNLGWAARPDETVTLPANSTVAGILRIARDPATPPVLIAGPPLAALDPSRIPTIDDIPDNHLAYAWQWFGFAAVLAIIYAIYTRGWRRERKV